MLERARQVLELTYHDWRLHERTQRNNKAARKRVAPVRCQPPLFSSAPEHSAFA